MRYYDPEAGRFISRDPLGMWGDPGQRGNAQNYCGNNPVNRVDPMGDKGIDPVTGYEERKLLGGLRKRLLEIKKSLAKFDGDTKEERQQNSSERRAVANSGERAVEVALDRIDGRLRFLNTGKTGKDNADRDGLRIYERVIDETDGKDAKGNHDKSEGKPDSIELALGPARKGTRDQTVEVLVWTLIHESIHAWQWEEEQSICPTREDALERMVGETFKPQVELWTFYLTAFTRYLDFLARGYNNPSSRLQEAQGTPLSGYLDLEYSFLDLGKYDLGEDKSFDVFKHRFKDKFEASGY